MQVHKFGGASISTTERIQNVVKICQNKLHSPSLIVVSAMGKTTNALEKVLSRFAEKDQAGAFDALNLVKKDHYELCKSLFEGDSSIQLINELNDTFVEIEWLLEEQPEDPYNYLYDQIVSVGELASSKILTAVLKQAGLNCQWLDARDVLKSDNKYRNANVDWETTNMLIKKRVLKDFESIDFLITQGFIACTSENFTTTLGREGSDFSTAIFATALDAESMTVWKDVPGIMTSDPRINESAQLLKQLSYQEALAMTYYGAKVLHPKTIKPIMSKSIPLYVKSFIEPESVGTQIHNLETELRYPCIVVLEKGNLFLTVKALDNSFIREQSLGEVFTSMNKYGLVLKLDRNSPEALLLCVGDPYNNLDSFVTELETKYNIHQQKEVELLTLRHGNETEVIQQLAHKKILLKESAEDTVQYVLGESKQAE